MTGTTTNKTLETHSALGLSCRPACNESDPRLGKICLYYNRHWDFLYPEFENVDAARVDGVARWGVIEFKITPGGRTHRPPGSQDGMRAAFAYPADSAKNFPGISMGGRLLFSIEPPKISCPSGRTRIASPAFGLLRTPAPMRITTRLPAPVLR